jgi:hypothetical protein
MSASNVANTDSKLPNWQIARQGILAFVNALIAAALNPQLS